MRFLHLHRQRHLLLRLTWTLGLVLILAGIGLAGLQRLKTVSTPGDLPPPDLPMPAWLPQAALEAPGDYSYRLLFIARPAQEGDSDRNLLITSDARRPDLVRLRAELNGEVSEQLVEVRALAPLWEVCRHHADALHFGSRLLGSKRERPRKRQGLRIAAQVTAREGTHPAGSYALRGSMTEFNAFGGFSKEIEGAFEALWLIATTPAPRGIPA